MKEDGTPVQKIETNEQELNFVVNVTWLNPSKLNWSLLRDLIFLQITMLANTIHDGKPQKLFLMDVRRAALHLFKVDWRFTSLPNCSSSSAHSSVTLKRSPDTLQQRQQESEMSEATHRANATCTKTQWACKTHWPLRQSYRTLASATPSVRCSVLGLLKAAH